MAETVRIHYLDDQIKQIIRVEVGGIDIPCAKVNLEQVANEPLYLHLQIHGAHIELVEIEQEEEQEQNLREESSAEQPENDDF